MSTAMTVTRMRLERLAADRDRTKEKIEDLLQNAEDEQRDLHEVEVEQRDKYRSRLDNLDAEIAVLANELERANNSTDVSKALRSATDSTVETGDGGPVIYRTFAAYARDRILADFPSISREAFGPDRAQSVRQEAQERLERAVQHTLSSNVAGLLPPQHMAQILDIIDSTRPVVATARRVDLERGKLTYPKITGRPTVAKQTTEKTEAGTARMTATLEEMTADTYLGGGNLSWQAINWSSPNALQLWFDLAAEAYARETEEAACAALEAAAMGTASTVIGTVGTEDFGSWTRAALSGIASIYSTTSGRARTNTLYVSSARFFQLAGLGTASTLQLTDVGSLDIGTLRGTWKGMQVVGSYGFSSANTAIVGDSQALLVGETAGAPVEMRAVEPTIGGMEVGVIGAFQCKVFDTNRFIRI